MVDDLYSQFHKDPNIAIACLYADYKDQSNQTQAHILGSFLRQFLTTAQEPIPDKVVQKLKDTRQKGGKVGIEDILALLNIRLQQLKRAYICIDAIDELEAKVRWQLLNILKQLGTNNTRLFLTGRDHIESEVQNHLQVRQGFKVIISASQQDIKEFLGQQLEEDLNPDAMDEVLGKDVVDIIMKKSQGM